MLCLQMKAQQLSPSCQTTVLIPIFNVDSAGGSIQLRSGTIDIPNIGRFGTTTPMFGQASVSRFKGLLRRLLHSYFNLGRKRSETPEECSNLGLEFT